MFAGTGAWRRGVSGARGWHERIAMGTRALPDPLRLRLAAKLALSALDRGRIPPSLHQVVADQFALADHRFTAGDHTGTAAALGTALRLAFHRLLHLDRLTSPLAADPAGFLAPLRSSAAMAALRARPTMLRQPRQRGGAQRLLFLTETNTTFLRPVIARYLGDPRVEVRVVELTADPAGRALTANPDPMMVELLAGGTEFGARVEARLRPHLDWADTVFMEWCAAGAVLLSLLDPGPARIIVRLHSYELFRYWPYLVDFGRVDDLVVVSQPMRDLVQATVPGLGGTPVHVVPNAMTLAGLGRPKGPEARFTLALIGYSAVAKDALWALDVVRLLRSHDPRFRLLLYGQPPDPDTSAGTAEYARRLRRGLADLQPTGAVQPMGHTTDVAQALTNAGVVLSSSVRESFHLALVEGAASGAVPVVRDWPYFAALPHGARGIFPAEWVVSSPAAAVERILATTASDAVWRAAGEAAARHALATWDLSVTGADFDRVLLAQPGPGQPHGGAGARAAAGQPPAERDGRDVGGDDLVHLP